LAIQPANKPTTNHAMILTVCSPFPITHRYRGRWPRPGFATRRATGPAYQSDYRKPCLTLLRLSDNPVSCAK
jgi:hypothetical protein